MISAIRGRIAGKLPGVVLIDLHGLTFKVLTSQTTVGDIGSVGEEAELVTHLYVREDQLTLFGFSTSDELRLFEALLTVSGIGPRVALNILSSAPPEEVHRAIASEDVGRLSQAPGIGRKTAQRIIFDLRGKLPEPAGATAAAAGAADGEALEALLALGYSVAEARQALAGVERREGQTVEERVFAALRTLAQS